MSGLCWLMLMGCSFFSDTTSPVTEKAETTIPQSEGETRVKDSLDVEGQDENAEDLSPLPFTFVSDISSMMRPTRSSTTPYTGELIDTHLHVWLHSTKESSIKAFETVLNDNNVTRVVFMPTPFQGSNPRTEKGVQKLTQKTEKKQAKTGKKQKNLESVNNKNRSLTSTKSSKQASQKIGIIRGLGAQRVGWFCDSHSISSQLKGDKAMVESRRSAITKKARTDLRNPLCIGLGEVGVAHGSKREGQPSMFMDIDHGILMEVLDDVMRAEKWMDVHLEPLNVETDTVSNQSVFQSLVKVCRQFPSARLIVSHTMMTNPQNVRNLLETCPNVYTNIKILNQEWESWQLLEPIHNAKGQVYEDWATLFEEMPTRFFIGTDYKLWREEKDDAAAYAKTITDYRLLLGTLKPDVAEKIAYQNADRLLFGR